MASLGCFIGCSDTVQTADRPTTITHVHHATRTAPTLIQIELEQSPAPAATVRYVRPNQAGPGFYVEPAYAFAPGCECTISAATLDVAIPCGQSACVNDKLYDCTDANHVSQTSSCEATSACQCEVDTDGPGPKGFSMDCGTTICFEGRATKCSESGKLTADAPC